MFASEIQRPFCSLWKFLPWAHRLVTAVVAGRWLEEEGCGDRVTEWISAGQQIYLLSFVARNILASHLRPLSQAILNWLWVLATRDWRKKRTRYPSESFRIIKAAGRMFVCVCVLWWNIKWLDYNKKRLFSVTSIWRIFLLSPSRLSYSHRWRRITRRVQ
jgi:hypothetical protein